MRGLRVSRRAVCWPCPWPGLVLLVSSVAWAQAARGVPVDPEAVAFARVNGDVTPAAGTGSLTGEVGAHFGSKSPHYLSVEFARGWLGGESLSSTYKGRYSFQEAFAPGRFKLEGAFTLAVSQGYAWLINPEGSRFNMRVSAFAIPLAVGVAHPVELADGLVLRPWLQVQTSFIFRHQEGYDRTSLHQADGTDRLYAAVVGATLALGPVFAGLDASVQGTENSSGVALSCGLTVGGGL